MRAIRARWRRIPRPVRIVGNLLLAAVLLGLFYVFRGCPDLNAEQAYRREAARNLVGPGEILGTLQVGSGYDHLLLAETGEGVILYCYIAENHDFFPSNQSSSWDGDLIYREKGEVVTVMAAPGYSYGYFDREEITLPMIVFDDCPQAVRAELDLHLTGTLNSVDYDYSYHLRSQRQSGGYFVFDLVSTTGTERETYAIAQVSRLYEATGGSGQEIPAAVRLYDQQDELIWEQTLTLRSAAGEAHARREAGGEG